MAIPSKEDFEQVFDLYSSWCGYSPIPLEDIDKLKPDATMVREKLSELYDAGREFITKLENLEAYKWICSQHAYGMFKQALFNTKTPQRNTKEVFVDSATRWLMGHYKPLTKVGYFLYKQSYERKLLKHMPEYISHYGPRGYSKADIEKRYREVYPLESLEQLNNEKRRLDKFNFRKTHAFYLEADLQIEILQAVGQYLYNEQYLDGPSGKTPFDEEELASYKHDAALFYDASDAIGKLIPAIEHFIVRATDFRKGIIRIDENTPLDSLQLELKQNVDLLIHLEDIGRCISSKYDSAVTAFYGDDYDDEPLIKRLDRTARERVLANDLWRCLRKYKESRPVMAVEWLLQLEGVKNITDRRTIERWLESWDKKMKKEWENEERVLSGILPKLGLS